MNYQTQLTNRLLRSGVVQFMKGPAVPIGPKTESPQSTIKINRTDDEIETIEVVCTCGEKTVIRCDYA